MLVTTGPEQRQGSRSHLCLDRFFLLHASPFYLIVFFVSLSTVPFTDRPCVRLLTSTKPGDNLFYGGVEINIHIFGYRYDGDCASTLRGSGACVLVAICHTLCVKLRAEFTPRGHSLRQGACRIYSRRPLTATWLVATALSLPTRRICSVLLPVLDRVCFHLVLYASSDCHPVEVNTTTASSSRWSRF